MLQCVAVCCGVLQSVFAAHTTRVRDSHTCTHLYAMYTPVYNRALLGVFGALCGVYRALLGVCEHELGARFMYCSVLQCVAVCAAVWCSVCCSV